MRSVAGEIEAASYGTVILAGTVHSRAEHDAAVTAAWSAPGVTEVDDRIVAETQGNPLALLEPPRGVVAFGAGGWARATGRGAAAGADRRELSPAAGGIARTVPAAAAGGGRTVRRPFADIARGRTAGIPVAAAAPAVDTGLVEFGTRVRFRHPLLRSASYRAASVADRQAVHGALAGPTDPQTAPERRAWHRAQAATGPDEEVAAELERSAGRAQARGALAAAAAS